MRIYVSIIKKRIILSAHGKRYASIQHVHMCVPCTVYAVGEQCWRYTVGEGTILKVWSRFVCVEFVPCDRASESSVLARDRWHGSIAGIRR